MNYQVSPAATQRFGAEAIGTNERWQHGLTCGRHDDSRPLGVRQMDLEHTAIVNRPATSQQVPVGHWPTGQSQHSVSEPLTRPTELSSVSSDNH